ncbi:purine-cytosine permease-like transporter [Caldisphaera lagunensis DSM 15908]|uniref:Purine-cytosine permease-like transporter n=1 Tax=Caldisphaera lagunensis (strain DSM 15908 / JCM 11604 / ANMR 0165 / IC-154) TaxID=1056495 RepID=L0AAY3_CALLD|nr:cytosine permease [Caldisphaera lagunensis]AFZ70574.1 purine-cytosine permease-like transporter [Caldisphaera lagunensis DSM 15908]
MSIEWRGVERVEKESRHGKPISIFIIWLASNLTIADFALGSFLYGLPLPWIIFIVIFSNIIAGLIVGLLSSMGPKFGLPQMMISGTVYGKKINKVFSFAQWLSTLGWFSVNVIIGAQALVEIVKIPYYASLLINVVIMAIIGIYGIDMLHSFERAMSIILGALFLFLIIISLEKINGSIMLNYNKNVIFSPYLAAIVFAGVFSYMVSWAPYASDYTRYLPENTSMKKIILYATLGSAIAGIWTEVAGTVIYIASGNPSLNIMQATSQVIGKYLSVIALISIVLGGLSANALNLYSNSLSAQTLSYKFKRVYAALAGAIIGFLLAYIGSVIGFEMYYENFLLTLDYWIMPWAGILIASFFIRKRIRLDPIDNDYKPIISYIVALLISLPFMNLTSYGLSYEGIIAKMLGGADISYFVSFFVSMILYLILTIGNRKKSFIL